MSVETLSMLGGALLSLVFAYVPGADAWYAALDGTRKRLAMLAALLVVTICVVGVSCAGLGGAFGVSVECSASGAALAVRVFILALVANQAAYLIAPVKSS